MAEKSFKHKVATVMIALLVVAMPVNVFAKMDGIVLKDSSGKLSKFNYDQLKTSLLNDGTLYEKFQSLKKSGASVYSYHDDVQGKYVLRSALISAFLDSTGTSFNARLATETLQTTEMSSTVYNNVEKSDGTIEETAENSTSLPSFTITAEYNSDLAVTKVTIKLDGVAATDLSKYVVKYDGAEITPNTTDSIYKTTAEGNVELAVAKSKVSVELVNSSTNEDDFDVDYIQ